MSSKLRRILEAGEAPKETQDNSYQPEPRVGLITPYPWGKTIAVFFKDSAYYYNFTGWINDGRRCFDVFVIFVSRPGRISTKQGLELVKERCPGTKILLIANKQSELRRFSRFADLALTREKFFCSDDMVGRVKRIITDLFLALPP